MQICSQIRWRAVPGVAFAPPAAHHRSRCLGTRGIASPIITKGPELFDNNKVLMTVCYSVSRTNALNALLKLCRV